MTHFNSINRNIPILVVDDLSAMRRITKNCLNKLGFENITEAESAEQALELLKANSFNLVISDWNISDLKTADLLRLTRENCNNQKLPILLVANESHKQEAQAVSDNQSTNYIVKPFTSDLLQEKMQTILQK